MKTRQESTAPGRWSELLLGGTVAGVGAPLLLKGVRRWLHLGRGGTPASVGWMSGLLGALVAGGLARRHRSAGAVAVAPAAGPEAEGPSAVTEEAPGFPQEGREDGADGEWVADWRREVRRRRLALLEPRATAPAVSPGHEVSRRAERGPRRGPSGREQPWHEVLDAAPA